jgi:hypothetical protein
VHVATRDPYTEHADEDEADSTFPDGKDNRGSGDILSKINDDDQKVMLEQNRMLLKFLLK